MAEFGFWELAVVMLVALLIVGPERLPTVASHVGQWIGKARRLAQTFKDELSQAASRDQLYKTIGDQDGDLSKIKDELQKTGSEINQSLRELDPLAHSIESQIEAGRFAEPDTPDSALDENYDSNEQDKKDEPNT